VVKVLLTESIEMLGYDSTLTPTSKYKTVDEQEAKGFTVHYSDSMTLNLDLDNEESLYLFRMNFAILQGEIGNFRSASVREYKSKSGNTHVIITLGIKLTVQERLLLEVCLGSDRKRGLLAWMGLQNGVEEKFASMLFEPPEGFKSSNVVLDEIGLGL